MIARLWHGVTSHENAKKYEDLLRGEILPGIIAIIMRRIRSCEKREKRQFSSSSLWL